MDQRDLVVRARGGDHDAFSTLVDLTVARLDSAARLILRDPELARDAVQESLIRAWRDLPGLRDPDRFDAWVHRLTVNSCLDLARRRRRRVIEVELEQIDMASPSDLSGGVADRDQLERALGRLDAAHRAVIVLHYYLDGRPRTDARPARRRNAIGHFDEIDAKTLSSRWQARISTKGASDLYVLENRIAPGGSFG